MNCADSDGNMENVPSTNDVCTATCTSGQTPTVAMATCQANMMFDVTLECPAGTIATRTHNIYFKFSIMYNDSLLRDRTIDRSM